MTYRFFAYLPDDGFQTYTTEEEALSAAEDALDAYRTGGEGWPLAVELICVGTIGYAAIEAGREEEVDYVLSPLDALSPEPPPATPDERDPDDLLLERLTLALGTLRGWHGHAHREDCAMCGALALIAEGIDDFGYQLADDTASLRGDDTCPECGRTVYADAPAGLCPRCEDEARGDDTDGDLDEYDDDTDDVCEECGDRDQTCEHGCCSRCCACWDEPHAADPDIVDGEG